MFGGQHRIDLAETARASWGDTSETRQPWRRDPRAVGKVCSWTEKIRIKSLETVGVVRDGRYLPADMGPESGESRSAATAMASTPHGADADADDEPAAGSGHERRPATEE